MSEIPVKPVKQKKEKIEKPEKPNQQMMKLSIEDDHIVIRLPRKMAIKQLLS